MSERTIRDCNVCVIGGAGFLGSHLVNHLIDDRQCRVLVLDNLISGLRKHIHPAAKFVWHDIRDGGFRLTELFATYGTRFVFNYAAEPYIPECFDRPEHFFNINAVAVLNVLNACQIPDVEALLQVSSAEIYGDSNLGKIKEDHPIQPHSTYGVSKVAADGLVQVRWREAKVPAIALRQFNCIGERETHEYVVPEIISQLAKCNPENDSATISLGNDTTRDFLYAGDAVRMAVELLECGEFGEVYNVGSESPIRIHDLALLIGRVMRFNDVKIEFDPAKRRPWDIWHLQSDNTKLFDAIGSRQITSLQTAIEKTVNYYRVNGNKWDW